MNFPTDNNFLYVKIADHEIQKFEDEPSECEKIVIENDARISGRVVAYLQKKEGVSIELEDAVNRIKNFLATEKGIKDELHERNGIDLIIYPPMKAEVSAASEDKEINDLADQLFAPMRSDAASSIDTDSDYSDISPPVSPKGFAGDKKRQDYINNFKEFLVLVVDPKYDVIDKTTLEKRILNKLNPDEIRLVNELISPNRKSGSMSDDEWELIEKFQSFINEID